jgi:glucose/arabinose dehydrogenase
MRTRLGKILRIDVDALPDRGPRRYQIPSSNPFRARRGARPEILHYGLRNPWRFSFDRVRGDLWIGDVGQNLVEEINFVPAGEARGLNFGWNVFEGRRRFRRGKLDLSATTPPVAQYAHGADGCSVIGGYVYRGQRVRALRGLYVFGDFCSGRVWAMRAGPRPGKRFGITGWLGGRRSGITTFGEDGKGELLMAAGSSVYRLVPSRASRRKRGKERRDDPANPLEVSVRRGTAKVVEELRGS